MKEFYKNFPRVGVLHPGRCADCVRDDASIFAGVSKDADRKPDAAKFSGRIAAVLPTVI